MHRGEVQLVDHLPQERISGGLGPSVLRLRIDLAR